MYFFLIQGIQLSDSKLPLTGYTKIKKDDNGALNVSFTSVKCQKRLHSAYLNELRGTFGHNCKKKNETRR